MMKCFISFISKLNPEWEEDQSADPGERESGHGSLEAEMPARGDEAEHRSGENGDGWSGFPEIRSEWFPWQPSG